MRVTIKGRAEVAPCWASINHWKWWRRWEMIYKHTNTHPCMDVLKLYMSTHMKNTHLPHNSKKSLSFIFLRSQHLQLSVDTSPFRICYTLASLVTQNTMQSNLAAKFIFHFDRANKIMDICTTQMMSFTEITQTPSRLLKCEWNDKKRKDFHTWKPPHENPICINPNKSNSIWHITKGQ